MVCKLKGTLKSESSTRGIVSEQFVARFIVYLFDAVISEIKRTTASNQLVQGHPII